MSESNQQVARKTAIDQFLDHYEGQIQAALPTTVRGGLARFKRIVRTEVSKNPALGSCDPRSLFGAVIQAAQLGLEPGGGLRQCYLIPYKKECQLILGYAGMVALAARAGSCRDIQPRAVFKGDKFEYRFGINEVLDHVPNDSVDRTDGELLTHVYAIAVLPDGTKKFDVMTRAEVEAIRKRSPSARSDNSPWNHAQDYIPMAMKSVLRRLWKYLPSSAEVQQMVGLDEMADAGVHQNLGTVIDADYTRVPDEQPAASSPTQKVQAAQQRRRTREYGDPVTPAPTARMAERVAEEKLLDVMLDQLRMAEQTSDISATMRRVRELPHDEQDVVYAAANDAADRISSAQAEQ